MFGQQVNLFIGQTSLWLFLEHSIILKITILILPTEWNDRPTGEQPLKKKTMRLWDLPQWWCGKSLTKLGFKKVGHKKLFAFFNILDILDILDIFVTFWTFLWGTKITMGTHTRTNERTDGQVHFLSIFCTFCTFRVPSDTIQTPSRHLKADKTNYGDERTDKEHFLSCCCS